MSLRERLSQRDGPSWLAAALFGVAGGVLGVVIVVVSLDSRDWGHVAFGVYMVVFGAVFLRRVLLRPWPKSWDEVPASRRHWMTWMRVGYGWFVEGVALLAAGAAVIGTSRDAAAGKDGEAVDGVLFIGLCLLLAWYADRRRRRQPPWLERPGRQSGSWR